MKPQKLIGHVRAVVDLPLYEGDFLSRKYGWNDFIYEEPGVTASGDLGVCRRKCKTISSKVILIDEAQNEATPTNN